MPVDKIDPDTKSVTDYAWAGGRVALTDDAWVRVGVEVVRFSIDSPEILARDHRISDIDILLSRDTRYRAGSLSFAPISVEQRNGGRETYVFDGEGIAV